MAELKNVERIQQQPKWYQRFLFNKKTGTALAVVGTATAVSTSANAGVAEVIFSAITAEVTSVLSSQEALYGVLIVFFIALLIWRMGKRTVNSG
jgi:hypothetical protein